MSLETHDVVIATIPIAYVTEINLYVAFEQLNDISLNAGFFVRIS